jgi:hypothetical protein|nr:MAG TPA: hypothetical protein [Bacteriophage sp.]
MLKPEEDCCNCLYKFKTWFETPCKNCNGNPDTHPNGTDNFVEQIDSTNDIAALFEDKE